MPPHTARRATTSAFILHRSDPFSLSTLPANFDQQILQILHRIPEIGKGSITGASSSTRMLLLLHRGGYAPPRGDAATTTGSAPLVSLLLLGHVNRSEATFHRNHQSNRHVVKRVANWAREWKMSQNVSTGTKRDAVRGPGEKSIQ